MTDLPAFPEPTPAILTDIRLFSTDLQAFTDGGTKDLIVRTTMFPDSFTCTVGVYVGDQPGGGVGRLIAQRTIFTGTPVTDVPSTGGNTSTIPSDPGTVVTDPPVVPIVPADPQGNPEPGF